MLENSGNIIITHGTITLKDGESGAIKIGKAPGDGDGDTPCVQLDATNGLTMYEGSITLGLSSITAGDFAVSLDADNGLTMHKGSIKLGRDSDATEESYFFSVTSEGKMILYHPDSVIELG
jgi:hypothetical protein